MKEVYGVNIILSYLIFNPLEACVLLLGCELFKKKEFDNEKLTAKQLLIDSYKLGFILCTFNMVGLFIATGLGSLYVIVFQALSCMCFLPSFTKLVSRKYSFVFCLLVSYVYAFTSMIFISGINMDVYYETNGGTSLLLVAIQNLKLRGLQLVSLMGGFMLKSLIKAKGRIRRFWDGFFTLWGATSEPMPESLSKMAEEDSDDSTEVE